MTNKIRFCLVLHNHQPIGNFDGVFEQAYQDSYLPFLDLFEPYQDLRISLHTSGPLMEWLDAHHPEYLDRLTTLVEAGRIEIIGGPFYEPIMTMIPPRDRIGQIQRYTRWLENRLRAKVRGMWMPERVWEQSLTTDIVDAGIEYTLLDDFHFRNAGLADDQLAGYYLTEDNARILRVFPGSERLRYLIPFADPQETIEYARQVAERHPRAALVFGDDGEKFGTWPDTKQHVYNDGWLTRFFDALHDNREWLDTTTLSSVVDQTPAVGKIYLPDGSYREMTEWVLPADLQVEYEDVVHEFEHDPRWPRLQRFLRGGFWRNFRAKYPEADEMYARMMAVSNRLHELETLEAAKPGTLSLELLNDARRELYRGQCNCSYWHGAFGGIYLPHLRHAVFNHLIAAENLLDRAIQQPAVFVEADSGDYNLDGQQEIRLANDKVLAFLSPTCGGQLYELDVRSICHNLLATLTRRPEAYHRKVLAGAGNQDGDVASIHDRVVFKQENLDQRLQYDKYSRKSMLDHFFHDHVGVQAVQSNEAEELGDFLEGVFETKLRRKDGQVQVLMSRRGMVAGCPVQLTKGLTLQAGSSVLEIAYLLEGLPAEHSFRFAPEFNFAGMPSGADDRYFYQEQREQRVGQLGTRLDLQETHTLGLVDEWLGIDVSLTADRPTSFWAFPIEAVSQSEGGFELVHQSVAAFPHWIVTPDVEGRWSTTLRMNVDTTEAERRMEASREESYA